jgi:hypothetical protein
MSSGNILLQADGYYLFSEDDRIEECIEVANGERPSIQTEEPFMFALELVDLDSTEVMFEWGELKGPKRALVKMADDIGGDEDLKSASEEVVAIGCSKYFSDDFRAVGKLRFDSEAAAAIFDEALNADKEKNLDEFFDYYSTFFNVDFYFLDYSVLTDNFTISHTGPVLTIEFKAGWEDLSIAHEKALNSQTGFGD